MGKKRSPDPDMGRCNCCGRKRRLLRLTKKTRQGRALGTLRLCDECALLRKMALADLDGKERDAERAAWTPRGAEPRRHHSVLPEFVLEARLEEERIIERIEPERPDSKLSMRYRDEEEAELGSTPESDPTLISLARNRKMTPRELLARIRESEEKHPSAEVECEDEPDDRLRWTLVRTALDERPSRDHWMVFEGPAHAVEPVALRVLRASFSFLKWLKRNRSDWTTARRERAALVAASWVALSEGRDILVYDGPALRGPALVRKIRERPPLPEWTDKALLTHLPVRLKETRRTVVEAVSTLKQFFHQA